MRWAFASYSIPLAVAAVLAAALAVYAWRSRRVPGANGLVLLLVTAGIWALANALQLSSLDLPTKLFWTKMAYFGIVGVPAAWLAFVLRYTGLGPAKRRNLVWLGVEPAITLALVWTNEAHGGIWAHSGAEAVGEVTTFATTYGPWFWVNAAYSYLIMIAGSALLVYAVSSFSHRLRRWTFVMFLGVLLPWVANVLFLTRLGPFPFLDLTPFAFVLAGLALTLGLFRLQMLDLFLGLVPVARGAVVEAMSDAVIVLDASDRVADLNAAAVQLIGLPLRKVVGEPLAQVLAGWPTGILAACASGEGRFEMGLGDGAARRDFDVLVSLLRSGGRRVGKLLVLRDVTERRHAELLQAQALAREQEARAAAETARKRFAFLAEASKKLASSLDYETTLASVSRLAVPSLADCCIIDVLADDERRGKVTITHVDPERERQVGELWRRRRPHPSLPGAEGEALRADRAIVFPEVSDSLLAEFARDGEELDLLRSLAPVSHMVVPLVARGKKLGAVLLTSETPDRRYGPDDLALAEELGRRAALAVENALLYRDAERHSAQMVSLLGSLAEGVLVVGSEGRVVVQNEAARLILRGVGAEAGMIDAWRGLDVSDADGRPLAFAEWPICRSLRGESFSDVEVGVTWDDGLRRRLVCSGGAVCDEAGKAALAIIVFRDVTELRRLEQVRNEYVQLVSHDLRNPLTVLLGQATWLHSNLARKGLTREAESVAAVVNNARRMNSMIQDLVDSVRLEAGQPELRRVCLDLRRLLSDVLDRAMAREERSRVTLDSPDSVPPVLVDPDRLERAFTNLVTNALKYSPSESPVVVRISPTEEEVVVAVVDRGVGIASEDLPRVFEKFYRVETNRAPEGLGLGLYITRLIAEAHGGRVWAESEEGQGSTFSLALPIAIS